MRCSLLRPKWRTTGRVWVTHRRTLLGWITRTVSSTATQIGVGPKRPVRSFRGSSPVGSHPRLHPRLGLNCGFAVCLTVASSAFVSRTAAFPTC